MISKGKVSSEELRQQFGEHIPSALDLASKAMGVSTAQLNKMMERGELMAEDLLPKLAQALKDKRLAVSMIPTASQPTPNAIWIDSSLNSRV